MNAFLATIILILHSKQTYNTPHDCSCSFMFRHGHCHLVISIYKSTINSKSPNSKVTQQQVIFTSHSLGDFSTTSQYRFLFHFMVIGFECLEHNIKIQIQHNGTIIYLFYGRSLSRYKQSFFQSLSRYFLKVLLC